MRYTIRNIDAWAAFKFGGLIGGVLGFFPALTLGLTLRSLVHSLRTWLESWVILDIPLVGSYSLLDAANLQSFLTSVQKWDNRSWLFVLVFVFLGIVLGAFITGFLSALGAAIYNLVAGFSGGLVVEADALDGTAMMGSFPATAMPSASTLSGDSYPPATVISATPDVLDVSSSKEKEASAGWLIRQMTQEHFPVRLGETRLGSGVDNEIVLPELAVNHATIRWENGRFILYDYSEGQTWVNGRSLVGPNMIKTGFQIRLGDLEFLFQV